MSWIQIARDSCVEGDTGGYTTAVVERGRGGVDLKVEASSSGMIGAAGCRGTGSHVVSRRQEFERHGGRFALCLATAWLGWLLSAREKETAFVEISTASAVPFPIPMSSPVFILVRIQSRFLSTTGLRSWVGDVRCKPYKSQSWPDTSNSMAS